MRIWVKSEGKRDPAFSPEKDGVFNQFSRDSKRAVQKMFRQAFAFAAERRQPDETGASLPTRIMQSIWQGGRQGNTRLGKWGIS